MESRRDRQDHRGYSGLGVAVIALIIFTTGCSENRGKALNEVPDLPQILVLPFHIRGPQMPDMMDVTETMIYFLKNKGYYLPRDAGEALDIVRQYELRGIYPPEKVIRKIGTERHIDFILIGKIGAETSANNHLKVATMDPDYMDIRIRLINAHTGKLKQVIYRQVDVDNSVIRTINEELSEIAEKL